MDQKPVTYVRFSRRTRGFSYLLSCATIPILAILILVIYRAVSIWLWLRLGPAHWKLPVINWQENLTAILFAGLLGLFLVVLFLPPKRFDRLIDWFFGL